MSFGWLVRDVEVPVPTGLWPAHAELLKTFLGIQETWNLPESSWLLNQNFALAPPEAPDCRYLNDYQWMFSDSNLPNPFDWTEFYVVAQEANGNATLCNRVSGAIVLSAPDHAFDYVREHPGCPPYSYYDLIGAPDFSSWVEKIAEQCLAECARPENNT